MKKQFTAILALLMTASCFASCGETAGTETADTQNQNTQATETTAPAEIPLDQINRENAVLKMPEVDFGGETINILHPGERVYAQDIVGDAAGDIVDIAVYERNLAIEELLGVTLNPIVFDENTQKTADHLASVVLAAEDLYDLASTHQAYTVKYLSEGYFHNFIDDKYIDWEKPWWNLTYMQEMVVGNDSIYFLMGDISLMRMKSLGCIYYNKEIYKQLFGEGDELYDTVFDGKWTFDLFAQMTKDAYADLNGDGKVNDGDRFGAFTNNSKSLEHFIYAMGVTCTTRDSDGIPVLSMNTERTVAASEKLLEFYHNNDGVKDTTDSTFADVNTDFANGEILFAPTWFRHADEFRDMKQDYGIIIRPKFDENDTYRTLLHDGTTVFCTPVTSQKTDIVGAVCEAMAFYNYKDVTPSYYEVALKVKYARDEQTSQMLDLISETAYTDFGYVYSLLCSGLTTYRDMVTSKSQFASWYAKKEKIIEKGLSSVIDLYRENVE